MRLHLPNHSPLVIAEQFGTLESLFPGRIDLGLRRAPGTDQRTVLALRRDGRQADRFPGEIDHRNDEMLSTRYPFFAADDLLTS